MSFSRKKWVYLNFSFNSLLILFFFLHRSKISVKGNLKNAKATFGGWGVKERNLHGLK